MHIFKIAQNIFAMLCVVFSTMAYSETAEKAPEIVPVATASQPAAPGKQSVSTAPTNIAASNNAAAAPATNANYVVTLTPGSLKSTIIRLAKEFNWQTVIWHVPNDYEWVGDITVHGKDFPDILNQILVNYPIQAVFYEGNRVLLIVPRTLSNND